MTTLASDVYTTCRSCCCHCSAGTAELLFLFTAAQAILIWNHRVEVWTEFLTAVQAAVCALHMLYVQVSHEAGRWYLLKLSPTLPQ